MSYPRYPEYRDSGVEWLGEVPAHWNTIKLKRRLYFSVGWTPPTGNDAYFNGDLPWANISDLGPKIITSTAKTISDLAVQTVGLELIPKESLLFSFKLSIGQVSFCGIDMYSNEAIAAFPPQPHVDLDFMYYALPIYILHNANENIYGAKLLNQDLIKNAYIADIPAVEQQAIAAFLDHETARIDGLIARQEQMIALSQEKRKALISHAVTRGLDPDAPLKDSGVEWLGLVPAHWEVTRIKNALVSSKNGVWGDEPTDDNAVWCVRVADFNRKDNTVTTVNPTYRAIATRDKTGRLLQSGNLLIEKSGGGENQPVGFVVLFDYDEEAVTSNFVAKLEIKDSVSSVFLLYVFAKLYAERVNTRSIKQNTGIQNLDTDSYFNEPIAYPPLDEQQTIAVFLDHETARIDTLVAKAKSAIDLLKEHRASLISAAVTGKIDVRGFSPGASNGQA